MKKFRSLLLVSLLLAASPAFAQQGAAAYETRLSALEDSLRSFNGQVEQLGFSIRRLDQTVQRLQSDYDMRLNKLESSVATLSAQAERATAAPPPPAQSSASDGTLGSLKTRDGRVTGAVNALQAPTLPEQDAETPQEQYDEAFDLLRQANYEEAGKAFKEFIDKNPKDKMIDNAKYWHAETLYVRGRFADAAVGFGDAYQSNPQGTKAPDSLLKLGMTLAALNKAQDACVTLTQLKTKYPNASATVKNRAAEERTKLKCNG